MLTDKASVYLSQNRLKEAEKTCLESLSKDPEDMQALLLLSSIYIKMEKPKKSIEAAKQAVTLDPEFAAAHWTLGRAYLVDNDIKNSKAALDESMRLDPEDPDNYLLTGAIEMDDGNNKKALSLFEKGLTFDPEKISLMNMKGNCLQKMGKTKEAEAVYREVLRLDPENGDAIAGMGHAGLRKGNEKESLEYFKNALQMNPGNPEYKAGLIMALKSKFPVYGMLLRFTLWLMSFDQKTRLYIIFGGMIAFRALKNIARQNPDTAVFIYPLLIAYGAFILFSWIADPLLNSFLMINPYGRYALSENDRKGVYLFLSSTALLTASILAGYFLKIGEFYMLSAVLGGFVILSGNIYGMEKSKRKTLVMSLIAGFVATGLLAVSILMIFDPKNGTLLNQTAIIGFVASMLLFIATTWVAGLAGEK